MPDNKESNSRRRLLTALTAGTTAGTAAHLLPTTWSNPVIRSAVLPAHAQATGETRSFSLVFNGATSIDTELESIAQPQGGSGLLRHFIANASAGDEVTPICRISIAPDRICADVTGDIANVFAQVSVSCFPYDATISYSATATVGGSQVSMAASEGNITGACLDETFPAPSVSVRVDGIVSGGLEVTMVIFGTENPSVVVPVGVCTRPASSCTAFGEPV
jgi:hypothetical protein